jgi:DNA modification methylase
MVRNDVDKITMVPIKDLKPFKLNRKSHPKDQVARLAELIAHHGFRDPPIVDKETMEVIAGNGTLLAAKLLKMTEVPCILQTFESDEARYTFSVSHNAIQSWSEIDLSAIHKDLESLAPFNIDMLGVKDFQFEPTIEVEGEDEAPAVPSQAKSELGDLWILGEHRLMCGDSTNIGQVEMLMDGQKADMVFTDPPYNQSHSGGGFNDLRPEWTKHRHGNLNDFDPQAMFSVISILKPQSAYFFCNKGLLPQYLDWAKNFNGWDLLVMAKNNPIPAKGMKYLSDLEYIVFVREKGAYFNDQLEYDFYRKFSQISVKGNEFGHPTEKQIKVIEPYLKISSDNNSNVLDLFGGSGSTLIACEKTKRKCFMMELDPKYVDVILGRWAKFTGKDPVRDDGTKWSTLSSS